MKKNAVVDPHAAREAQKYSNPIPSREVILELLEQATGPLNLKQVSKSLHLDEAEQKEALRRRLIAMERDGQIVSNRRGAYGKVDKMSLVKGVVLGHRDGFGFVIPTDGSSDVYLSSRQMRKVFNGDEVIVRPGEEDYRGRREGSIVEVLAHNTQQIVGRFVDDRGLLFVRPENPRIPQDIMVAPENRNNAKDGQLVVVNIVQQPSRYQRPQGEVAEILGDHMAPGMEIDVAIRAHGIPHIWPEEVTLEAEKYSPEVAEKDKRRRVDLREYPFVTIDGEDARDFDDAVYAETKRSGGWRLYVAIADVSHYVAVDSALDKEARSRGTSVYFPDFVVPMLPEVLSNGLCSLNPLVDRLAMVCEMTISAAGRISGYKFYEGVIHSHARLTYTQVGKAIAERTKKRSDIRNELAPILPQIDTLYDLYQALKAQREIRGTIDFETKETRILFDKQRKIERIVPVERNDAHKLIEECMLAANVCAAKCLEHQNIPGLYRVHEAPKEEKLANLKEFLSELGLGFKGEEVTPQDYRDVLSKVKGRPDAHVIQTVMLRSMNQAVYQPDNFGHFGLSFDSYAHFTSPIRRYPDLMVHRALRALIRSNIETTKVRRIEGVRVRRFDSLYPYSDVDVSSIGEQSSTAERRADDATRDAVAWLKCEFLQQRLGEEFDGIISSVTGFGLFIELNDLYVEGLVHITALPQDYYRFDAPKHRLVGERTRKVFRIGDQVRVQVVRVDLDERKVDFELVGSKPRRRPKKAPSTGKSVSAGPVSKAAKEMASEYEQEQQRKGTKPRKRKPVAEKSNEETAERATPKKKRKAVRKKGAANTKAKLKSKSSNKSKSKTKNKPKT